VKRLIITADDFGASAEVNGAIVRAYQEGILRHASLLVDAPAAKEAAALAKENSGLGVGLHLDLCPGDLPNPTLWGLRYFFSPTWRRRLIPEIRRQVDKFLSYGLKPSHADGHINIHVHPVIFPALASLCRDYGIPRIRLPSGESVLCAAFEGRRFPKNWPHAFTFRALEFYLRAQVPLEVSIPDRCFGLLRSGLMSEAYLLWLLERLPDGTTEIYFHPSLDSTSALRDRPTPTHQTITEFETLTSPRVQEAIERLGIVLV
jgi:predicted glycoside hydrolase/deacetylase ChbG (UPF0249 family)